MTVSPLTRITIVSLLVTLVIAPSLPSHAEDASVSSTVAGAAGTLNQAVGAYTQSTQQMNFLASQLASLNSLQGQMTPQLAALNQVKMNLAVAMAEAQQCVNAAKKDTSKYLKATIAGASLEKVEPSCSNYGNVIDSLKKNADELNEANTKMSCIRNLQNKINQIASAAKTPFSQLSQAANKVWGTRDQIINIHKGMVEQLDKDLNAEGGFKAQLKNLTKLSMDLNNTINGPASAGKDGMGSGLAQQITNLKRRRVEAANNWYYGIMSSTQQCFKTDYTQKCFDGAALSPERCIARYIGGTALASPAAKAKADRNSEILDVVNTMNEGKIMQIDQLANIDVKNPNAFLKVVQGRFESMLAETSQTFSGENFVGKNVDVTRLTSFYRDRYRACFSRALTKFNSDLASEGNFYKAKINEINDTELQLANQAKNWIDTAEEAMTEFKTSFFKSYNRDLSQFSANCTASQNPYESVDCLRKIKGMLDSGIKGHSEKVMLSDGSYVNVDSGTTTMTIPNLAVDAQGNPNASQTSTTCNGFKECINVLDQAKSSHEKAVQTETQNQAAFVKQYNSDLQTNMGAIAENFNTMSQLITSAVTGLNTDLAKLGVTAHLETKQVEGEALEPDDKTKLFKVPTNMKAAFAGLSGYTELGETNEVTSALNERRAALSKKMGEAIKMKNACMITKKDYESIARRLECDEKDICSDGLEQMISPLEAILHKSQENVSTKREDSEITKKYESCSSKGADEAKQIQSKLDSIEVPDQPDKKPPQKIKLNDKKEEYVSAEYTEWEKANKEYNKLSTQERELKSRLERAKLGDKNCITNAIRALDSLAEKSRDTVKVSNDKFMNAIRKIGKACRNDDPDAAVKACNQAKRLAQTAEPPTDEGPTVLGEESNSSKERNVIQGSKEAK